MVKIKKMFESFMEGSKMFGEFISSIINFILLFFVYFIGVGITSIVAKIFGVEFLDKKIDKKRKTYWKQLNLEVKPLKEYYRQF